MSSFKRISSYICLAAMTQNITFQTVYAMKFGSNSNTSANFELLPINQKTSPSSAPISPAEDNDDISFNYEKLEDLESSDSKNSSTYAPQSTTKYCWAKIDAAPTVLVVSPPTSSIY